MAINKLLFATVLSCEFLTLLEIVFKGGRGFVRPSAVIGSRFKIIFNGRVRFGPTPTPSSLLRTLAVFMYDPPPLSGRVC